MIERIFGVLKRRFRILLLAPEYDLDIQARIPAAAAVLHNFIRIHDPTEQNDIEFQDAEDDNDTNDRDIQAGDQMNADNNEDGNEHNVRRDNIAIAMWNQYQTILLERQEIDDDDDIGDDDYDDDDGNDDGNES